MGMDDSETVALVGGGHAFGKTHGDSNGTFTSGFEGPWTYNPTKWDNEYFKFINTQGWVPGFNTLNKKANHTQWSHPSSPGITMLTADLALGPHGNDPSYIAISEGFGADLASLDMAFKHAWYKLQTRDMGPHVRCQGDLVPPPQPWQLPLPAPSDFGNWAAVRE